MPEPTLSAVVRVEAAAHRHRVGEEAEAFANLSSFYPEQEARLGQLVEDLKRFRHDLIVGLVDPEVLSRRSRGEPR